LSNSTIPSKITVSPLRRWLLQGHIKEMEGLYEQEGQHQQHPWWQVMCLTGVDYFSTLGYQPGIAALAAGMLSPIATLILVLLTLFGALPIYSRVAAESPHGEGSIYMLEHLLPQWTGKLFVLCLLGFVATDFIITITLSAADATAHLTENPFTPAFLRHHDIGITLALITVLAAIFLKGFKEAIGIAVFLVAAYLVLNFVVIANGIHEVLKHPQVLAHWKEALFARHSNPLLMIGLSLLLFPKLALGLSGFETGVAVMPMVQGDSADAGEHLEGRIRNTRKLLTVAALIMSVFLITSSVVTTVLIKPEAFYSTHDTAALNRLQQELGRPLDTALIGKASGRALAYLAHTHFGDAFGTAYDLSTIFILWFAGASAMAGLLNIVPRYLPRYGMAPDWARAVRPLVLVFTVIAFTVTIIFKANVEAQGGAYATGVLVLMSSASLAVTLSARSRGAKGAAFGFGLITLVFIYTTIVNIFERPEGLKIASFFIGTIIFTSLLSRVWRSTELRVEKVEMDETAQRFIDELGKHEIRIIANHPDAGDMNEYQLKELEARDDNLIPGHDPIIFLEVKVADASEFALVLKVQGIEVHGYQVLRAESSTVPNAIAALLLHIRDRTGKIPHAYFAWTEGNPILYLLRFILFGEGDIAPVTREVLRQAEPNAARRPAIHLGGGGGLARIMPETMPKTTP
jgi:hypothetical protein